MKRERIARTDAGLPVLTPRQRERAVKYAFEMTMEGTSRRAEPSMALMMAALLEATLMAMSARDHLERFVVGMASAAPAREVARMALAMVSHLQTLGTDAERDAYLRMLMGDAGDGDIDTHTKTH